MTRHVRIIRFAFAALLLILPLGACGGVGASDSGLDFGNYGQ